LGHRAQVLAELARRREQTGDALRKTLRQRSEGTDQEAYEKLAYNIRTRAFFEALRRGLLNSDELEKAANDLEGWLQKDQKRFAEEQKREASSKKNR
jgi:hypothetical protein